MSSPVASTERLGFTVARHFGSFGLNVRAGHNKAVRVCNTRLTRRHITVNHRPLNDVMGSVRTSSQLDEEGEDNGNGSNCHLYRVVISNSETLSGNNSIKINLGHDHK